MIRAGLISLVLIEYGMNSGNFLAGTAKFVAATVFVVLVSWFARSRKRKIPSKWTEIGYVSRLCIYPLKSGKGVDCESLICTDSGATLEEARDRMFLVIGSDGKCKSGREYPRLTQISAEVRNRRLTLSAPETVPIEVDLPRGGVPVQLRIWGAFAEGIDCGDEASEWISGYLASTAPLRLLHRAENVTPKDYIPNMKKLLNFTHVPTRPTDTGLFSDTFSYHLVSESSVEDLNRRMRDKKVTPFHFRPNIVVSGEKLIPFEEDRWRWIKIGDVVFQFLAPCMRCSFTKVDPKIGEAFEDEPISTLRRYRIVREEKMRKMVYAPVMGIYLGVREKGVISVGETVSISETY